MFLKAKTTLRLLHITYLVFTVVFFQNNRSHMTKEAKRAAKLEKKLKVLLGGYQVSW